MKPQIFGFQDENRKDSVEGNWHKDDCFALSKTGLIDLSTLMTSMS